MCKFFNVNGIPYLTIAIFKLNKKLKIVDFNSDRTNIKHHILSDETGLKFPWLSPSSSNFFQVEEMTVYEEFLKCLEPNENAVNIKNENNFLYVLLGSNEITANRHIIASVAEFWRQFHEKHKFSVVYLDFEKKTEELAFSPDLNWFTIKNTKIKVKFVLKF